MVPNPLDKFQSHSIHYVILAARSTEDLREFSDGSESELARTLQAIDSCTQLGGQVKAKNGSNGVFLMLDTRRFSQFTIDNFELDTRIAGFAVPGSKSPNAVGLEMNFAVQDSSGISFANFLQYLMDKKLQVSFDGMTLLVRIIFIGHTPEGTTEVVQSIGIPAIFSQIQVDLNEARGVYQCKCIPLIGMVSNSVTNPKWTQIGTASSYFTGPGTNTLGAAVQAFERALNKESFRRYKEFNSIPEADARANGYGRPVQYLITLPKDWHDYKFTGPSQGGAAEINFKELLKSEEANRSKTASENKSTTEAQKSAQQNSAAPAKESFLAVNPNLTITEVLDVMFSHTLQVQQLANFSGSRAEAKPIKFYKHLITVTSSDKNFTVHVDIVEFLVPNANLSEDSSKTSTGQDPSYMQQVTDHKTGAVKSLPKNYLEYDYIFSSKNLDVLSLDLKIENLNLLLMQGTKIGQGNLWRHNDKGQKQENGESVGVDTGSLLGLKPKDPVRLRTLTSEERSNFSNIAGNLQNLQKGPDTPQSVSQQYTKNLSDFYNAGGQAKMTIRGNPDLMGKVVLSELEQHVDVVTLVSGSEVISMAKADVRKAWRDSLERNLGLQKGLKVNKGVVEVLPGPRFPTSPVFVKVNVYGPNVDFLSLDQIEGGDFAKELLTDNFYFLGSVKNKIEGSKFTQEFDLLQFSIYGHADLKAKTEVKKV